jgi:hypothetical protein
MRRPASHRALHVMTRPTVHRRSSLFLTSVGTGFLGLVPVRAMRRPHSHRLVRFFSFSWTLSARCCIDSELLLWCRGRRGCDVPLSRCSPVGLLPPTL